MKRCIGKYEIYTILTGLACIVGFFWLIFSIDTKPATTADYGALIDIAKKAESDFSSLLDSDCHVIIDKTSDSVNVTLENSECVVNIEYSKDYSIISFEVEDKSTNIVVISILSAILFISIFKLLNIVYRIENKNAQKR